MGAWSYLHTFVPPMLRGLAIGYQSHASYIERFLTTKYWQKISHYDFAIWTDDTIRLSRLSDETSGCINLSIDYLFALPTPMMTLIPASSMIHPNVTKPLFLAEKT